MEQAKSIVNVVVWAENRDQAVAIAAAVSQGTEARGMWVGTVAGHLVKAYIRYPNGVVEATPVDITDALIVRVSGTASEYYPEARKYVDARRGIPVKVFTGADDLADVAKEFDGDYVAESEVLAESTRNSLVNRAQNLDDTLRAAFSKLDLNGNGYITEDELIQASASLGHSLNKEEAHSITHLVHPDGNLPYPQFKSWWVLGRGNFNTFRRVVQIEMGVHKLVKKGSTAFNQYLESLEKETSVEPMDYHGITDIGPVVDFDNGMSFDVDIAAGQDFNAVANTLPETIRTNPFTYTLEIHLTNAEHAADVIQALEMVKAMASGAPKVQDLFAMGLEVNFRSLDTSVFLDITVGGVVGDMTMGALNVNLSQLNFRGVATCYAISGFKPTDLLNLTLEQIIEKLASFKVKGHSEFSNVKVLFDAIIAAYNGLGDAIPRQVRAAMNFLKVFAAVREIKYEFKYDVKELVSLINYFVGLIPYAEKEEKANPDENSQVALQNFSLQLAGYQQMVGGTIEQLKPMADMYLEQFGIKPALQAVNFDRITMSVYSGPFRFFYKASINFPGLTAFLNEKFLG